MSKALWLLFVMSGGEPTQARAMVPPNAFQAQNGIFYHYLQAPLTFSDIRSRILAGWYTQRGVHEIRVYCPYESSDEFRGVPAIDFFSTDPEMGTVNDFAQMVQAANAEGITVTMYISLLFVHTSSPLLTTRPELFRPEGGPPLDPLRPGDSTVGWSNGYATSWGFPALDYARPETRDFARSVLTFWMDLGVDGFEIDAPGGTLGLTLADATEIFVNHPRQHSSRDKWLMAEGTVASFISPFSDDVGLTHLLFNGDDDLNSVASRIMSGQASAESFELRATEVLDPRRAVGRGANTWSLYDLGLSAEERALDAAVHAASGVLYSIDYEEVYTLLSPEAQQAYHQVFAALGRTPALAPGASRQRVPTGDDPQHYAIFRRSRDDAHYALAVFNFSNRSGTVPLDLSGLELDGVTPTDLVTQTSVDPIDANTYAVSVDGLGYRFLAWSNGNPNPNPCEWQILDNTDSNWTVDGFTLFSDDNLFGGSMLTGDQIGAYAEITLETTEIEVYGSRGPGAGTLGLLVDGQSRDETDLTSGTDVYQTQLLASGSLTEASHTVRIEQLSATSAGWTGFDFIRYRPVCQVTPNPDAGVPSTDARVDTGEDAGVSTRPGRDAGTQDVPDSGNDAREESGCSSTHLGSSEEATFGGLGFLVAYLLYRKRRYER